MALTQKITPQKIYQKNDEIATHYKIQIIHKRKIHKQSTHTKSVYATLHLITQICTDTLI